MPDAAGLPTPMLEVSRVSRNFDVSKPWLQRVLGREPTVAAAGGGRRQLRHPARHHALARWRKRLRQVHGGAAGGGALFAKRRRDPLRGTAAHRGPRAARAQAADEHDLPGPVRLAQSALAGARHRCRADPYVRDTHVERRDPGTGECAADPGRAGAGRRREVSARIFRRPAPAYLDRAGAFQRAGIPGVRRAHQRARRVGAGADPQPDAGPAGAAGADLPVHQPQPGRGAAHVRPAGGDVSRPHRRAWSGGDDVPRRRGTPTRGCCWKRSPTSSGSGAPRTPVGGEVPSPIDPPPGCTFHPRCPMANARCRAEKPSHTRVAAAQGEVLVACHAVEEGRG